MVEIEVKDELEAVDTGGLQVNPELGDDALPAGIFPVGVILPEDRVELFRANGRVYTVPKEVNPRIAFAFMRDIRKKQSQEVAAANLLYAILGDDVIDFLADEDLEPEQMKAVMAAVQKHAMAATKKTLGNF